MISLRQRTERRGGGTNRLAQQLGSIMPGAVLAIVGILSMNSICLAQVGTWTTKSPMPTARFWFSCEVVNGKIYAIGGAARYPGPTLAAVEEYDPVSDTWTKKQNMLTPLGSTMSAVVDGKIYVIDTQTGVYDPSTDTWDITKAPMLPIRDAASACAVDGIVYVIGGVKPDGVASNEVQAYDPVTDTWTNKAPLPTGRWALSTAVVDGKIYAMGSGQGGKMVEEYDPATDTWTPWTMKAPMLVGNGYFGTGVVDRIIYTMGGGPGPGSQYSRVFAYDPSADKWSEKTAMSTARFALGAGVVNGKIYAIGGAVGWPPSPLSVVEEYTPEISVAVENNAAHNPTSFVLHQNHPNPFNPETSIKYEVSKPARVVLQVMNLLGQELRTLVDENEPAGFYEVRWDGRDNAGQRMPSGVYLYRIKAQGLAMTRKMVLLE